VINGFGMVIESLVSVLLLLTICYCVALNGRLKRLRTDERALREMIGELVLATDKAERAIGGLKVTVQECDQTLGERLRTAERITAVLDQQINSGGRIVGAAAADGGTNAPAPTPTAMVAAAHAFAERARSRVFGRAA
jgi:hypothetical protein